MKRLFPLLLVMILVLGGAISGWARPGGQDNGLPVYGMLGTLASELDSQGNSILITQDGPHYSLVGVTASVEREIDRIRRSRPGSQVKVWGTLYDSADAATSGTIVVTEIEIVGSSSGGVTPQLRVDVPTLNVRSGPSTGYPIIDTVSEGEVYDIVGKSAGRRPWWYICCLSGKPQEGWVSGDLATTIGNTDDVPVVLVAPPPQPKATPTPVPTPTPSLPPTPAFGEWQVTYYNDIHLSGTPLGVRNEPPEKYNLHRNWGQDSPWPGLVPADNWSGRYVSRWEFEGGNQYFEVKSDDGAKLFLDDILIIDSWRDGDSWDNNYFRNLSAGVHTVTIEYYERGGMAWLEANWYRVPRSGDQP